MTRRFAVLIGSLLLLLATLAPPASAHEERASQFPSGNGSVPAHRTAEQAADVLVVCKKPESAQRIAQMSGAAKQRNTELLGQCRFDHCVYFTEKAIDRYTGARVMWRTLGVERTGEATYADDLLVRSPTIVDCPGRVLDRGARQRNKDATITGRG